MSNPVSIAVLVSAGRHPVSGTARACRGDAIAMAVGVKLAGEALTIIHAGDPDDPSLRDYLALGAGRIEVIGLTRDADPIGPLAVRLKATDVLLTGVRTEQGQGSGLLPYALAHALGRPVVNDILDLQMVAGEGQMRQFLPKGKRRLIAATPPFIAAVHPMAPVDLCYAHARRVSGRIETVIPGLKDQSGEQSGWSVETSARRAVPLRAAETSGGHARMLSFIETPAKGGTVVFDGSHVDKAQILLSYLRDHQLVDF